MMASRWRPTRTAHHLRAALVFSVGLIVVEETVQACGVPELDERGKACVDRCADGLVCSDGICVDTSDATVVEDASGEDGAPVGDVEPYDGSVAESGHASDAGVRDADAADAPCACDGASTCVDGACVACRPNLSSCSVTDLCCDPNASCLPSNLLCCVQPNGLCDADSDCCSGIGGCVKNRCL
jgi:hypothetical protein